MSALRKRPKSLDSFAVPDTKPFKLQRVASFQVYAQKEKVHLSTLYPFLTQEQIYLKIKDRWNHMKQEMKQNYTKAVLYTTPTKQHACKKSPSKSSQPLLSKEDGQLKLLKDGKQTGHENDVCGNENTLSKSVASKAKVVDWLNNPMQRRLSDPAGLKKTYEGTRYNLSYGIPTVSDPTPFKQAGILKCGSSEKKKQPKKSIRGSRVSFSHGNENLTKPDSQGMKREGKPKKSVKKAMSSEYTNLCSLYCEDTNERNGECEQGHSETNSDSKLQPSDTRGLVFHENIEDELFTTPEIGKIPLQEIGKAPRKRRSSETRTERLDSRSRIAKPGKPVKMKTLNKAIKENSGNSIESSSDVFGDKVWAATMYSNQGRKRTPKKTSGKKTDKKPEERGRRLKDADDGVVSGRRGSLVGPVKKDSDGNAAGIFIRNKRGLIVGPVSCDFDDVGDEAGLSDESENDFVKNYEGDLHDEKDLKFGEINQRLDNKDNERQVSKSTRRSNQTSGDCASREQQLDFKMKKSTNKAMKGRYCSDFDDGADVKSIQKETEKQQKKESNNNTKIAEDMFNSESQLKHKMLSLCKDFVVEKPVSPIISEGDGSLSASGTDDVSYQGTTANMDGNPTLMKFLRKMKQITSPSIFDMGDTSPKLLSPTLSGITELSSLSTTSTAKESDQPVQSRLRTRIASEVKQPLEAETFPSTSKSALRHSTHNNCKTCKTLIKESKDCPKTYDIRKHGQKEAKEYTLCSLFQDMSQRDININKSSARRLVRSNCMPGSSNFDDMFEDQDIFQ